MKKLISKYPLITFLLALTLLFTVIFIGKKIRSQETEETTKKEVLKTIEIFDTSRKLQAPITGEINRADTIILKATTNGIVTKVLKAGDKVYRGEEIVKLSDTYSGSSQTRTAAAIAQRNAQFQNETFDTQQDILKAQKKNLNKTNNRQARIAWKQHFIQERLIELDHDTAQLQAAQAYATAALSKTVAPLAGQLEEVTVKVGDYVQVGKVLAVLKANNINDIRITAHIGAERASHIDVESKITTQYKGKIIPLKIIHLSQSSTGGQAYTLTFSVNKNDITNINDGAFIEINLPLQSEENILIPLDSIHFSTNSAEVYVASKAGLIENNNNKTISPAFNERTNKNETTYIAKLTTITIGEIIGSYVIVTKGLNKNAKIIMDRNVINGEQVTLNK